MLPFLIIESKFFSNIFFNINGQSSVWVAKLILDQTVGCSTREGVYFWVNWRYSDRYRLGHQPVISQLREGSMYSQAYTSLVRRGYPQNPACW